MSDKITIIGFLRGINVGGHHKVPMADLRDKLSEKGCKQVRTLLNSGNVVFETEQTNIRKLEQQLEDFLSQSYGFSIPFILRTQQEMAAWVFEDPFENIDLHRDIRLYVSFLKEKPPEGVIRLPYKSADGSFTIIDVRDRIVLSVLDLTNSRTPKGMDDLEKLFGKNITTRNWNTVKRVVAI